MSRDPRTSAPTWLSAPARRRPRTVIWLQILLALLAFFVIGKQPQRGLEELLPPATRSDLRFFKTEFPYPDDLFLFVRGGTARERELFLEDLESQLARRSDLFSDRLYKVDTRPLQQRLLFFLDRKHLTEMAKMMQDMAPRLEAGGSLLSWAQSRGKPVGLQAFYLDQLKASLKSRGRGPWKSPLDHLLSPEQAREVRPFWENRTQRYLQLEDDSHLMLVRPAAPSAESELRRVIREVAGRNPHIDVELTGGPAIVGEQRGAIARELAPGATFVAACLFLAMLVGLLPPARLLAAGLAGLGGLVLSAGGGAVLLGVGPIWLTAQALVAVLAGYLGLHYAVDRDLRHVFRVGAVAVLGFLGLALLPLKAPAQLGQACAWGTLACVTCLLTLVPALDQLGWIPPDRGLAPWMERYWPGRRPTRAILALTALLALVSLLLLEKNRFSADPLDALDINAPSLRTERERHERGTSALFALLVAPDLSRARSFCTVVRGLPRVKETLTLAQFLPPNPDEAKSRSIENIAVIARRARLPRPIPLETAADLQALAAAVPAPPGEGDLVTELGPGGIQDALRSYQKHLLEDLGRLLSLLARQRSDRLSFEELAPGVQQRLLGRSGAVAVLVFPKLAHGDTLEDFVTDLRRVNSRVGGPAVLAADLASLTRQALLVVPWTLGLGFLVGLAVVLRSPGRALLVVLGPSLALLFTQASLAWFRVALNFLTWLAPAVVLLLGVSVSLGTLRRPRASLRALFPAVTLLVVALSMLWSDHPGLAGLGLVMALGMGFNLLVAVLVLPAAQTFFRAVAGRRGENPFSAQDETESTEEK